MSELLLFTKLVDMSALYEGISIPVSIQPVLFKHLGFSLSRGEQKALTIQILGYDYDDAIIKNQWFDDSKYPGRKDIVQIRYSKNSLLAKTLRKTFSSSVAAVEEFLASRQNPKEVLVIPEDIREYIAIYVDNGIIRFDCIPRNLERINSIESDYGEELPQKRDSTSSVFRRKANVVNMAKQRANGRCQLCEREAPFMDKEGNPYLEVHHIIWLSRGGKDNLSNVVALCPNCHSKMHVVDDENDVSFLLRVAQE